MKPRFVLTVGAYVEEYPDVPDNLPLGIYDRGQCKMMMTIAPEYGNLICLETIQSHPFTSLQEWLSDLTDEEMASEGIPTTQQLTHQ